VRWKQSGCLSSKERRKTIDEFGNPGVFQGGGRNGRLRRVAGSGKKKEKKEEPRGGEVVFPKRGHVEVTSRSKTRLVSLKKVEGARSFLPEEPGTG